MRYDVCSSEKYRSIPAVEKHQCEGEKLSISPVSADGFCHHAGQTALQGAVAGRGTAACQKMQTPQKLAKNANPTTNLEVVFFWALSELADILETSKTLQRLQNTKTKCP